MLIGQVTHVLAALAPAVTEYVPALQFAHTADVVAPVSPEYVPALQFVHALAPAVMEYDPTAQFTHTVEEVAPTTPEYAPVAQFTHDALPLTFLNLPATQELQAPPSRPVYPTLHLQALIPELNIGELLFAGHAEHEVCI